MAFQNPGLFILLGIVLFSAAPYSARGDWDELEPAGLPSAPPPSPLVLICEWVSLWTFAGLAACLFLGGWRVPLLPESAVAPGLGAVIGAAFLQAKLWACALSIVGLRAAVGRVPPEPLLGLVFRWCVPTTIVGAVLAVLWAEGLDRYDLPRAALGAALCAFSALVAAHLVRRVHLSAARPATHGGVNPWL
jgi:hypothetical protein